MLKKKLRAAAAAGFMAASMVFSMPTVFAYTGPTLLMSAEARTGIRPGDSMQMTVEGIEGAVTWGVSGNTSSATIITQDGYLTIGADEAASAITVVATSNEDQSQSVMMRVEIIHEPETETAEITGIRLSGGGSVQAGGQLSLSATVVGNGNYDNTVSWAVSGNSSRQTYVLDGVLFAGEDEISGSVVVTVVANGDRTVSSSTAITVIPKPAPEPVVDSVTVTGSGSVKVGQTVQYQATVNGSNGFDRTVSWSVSGARGSGTRISQSGILTVDADESADTITVVAASNGDPSVQGEKSVTIRKPVEEAAPESKPQEEPTKQHTSVITDHITGNYQVSSGSQSTSGSISRPAGSVSTPHESSSASAANRPTGGTTASTISTASEQAINQKVTDEVRSVIGGITEKIKENAQKQDEENIQNSEGSAVVSKDDQVDTSDSLIGIIAGIVLLVAGIGIICIAIAKKKNHNKEK